MRKVSERGEGLIKESSEKSTILLEYRLLQEDPIENLGYNLVKFVSPLNRSDGVEIVNKNNGVEIVSQSRENLLKKI